ncbi:two-component system response regulator YesN [Evansella vedderi]|uniref:Two-component system response regulator YesN n=1 Tax=Evansella vedderi TaxID=38282 RepID=A0ABT9ZPV9_9BACI|nr:response regulator [Evansella vedderi]MDQ0253278.1 two-component system response regulator YesN [Evansella vedderi]
MNRVLIVEDELIIQKGLQFKVNWLKNDCIIVGCAENGEIGMEKIRELEPDIVLTDVRMPFKDGIEMLTESKKDFNYEAIILSGYSEFNYAKQAIRLGVHDYLLKPVDIKELERTLSKLVSKIEQRKVQENLKMNSLLYQDVLNININKETISNYVLEVIDYIKEHYHEKVTLKDVSDALHVSSVNLNSKFKDETSHSFNEFLTRYRIIKALEMLQNDKVLIYEVAEEVGFSDYKYFSQVFKKYIGMSPKQFLSRNLK